MKKLTYIFLSLLLLAGCTTRQEYATMRHGLDSINERNRNYESFTIDDVQPYVDYFDRHGEPNDRMLAYYMMGSAYRDEGNAPKALESFRIATEQADTNSENCDFNMLSRIYGQIATLFNNQRSPRLEIEAERKAVYYAWKAKDTLSAIIFFENLSLPYHMLNKMDSALYYSQESAKKYRELGRMDLAAGTLGMDIDIYLRQNDYSRAKEAIEEYEKDSHFFDDEGNIRQGGEQFYYYKGSYYEGIGRLDSAEFYYRKLMKQNISFSEKEGLYKGLLSIYQKLNNGDSIAKYSELYCQTNDSSSFAHSADEITRMQAIYNYDESERRAKQAEQKAERTRTLLLVLLAAGLIVVAAGTMVYLQYRNRKRAEIQQLTNDYGRALMEYNKQSAELERLKQEDSSLIEEKQLEVEELKEKLLYYQSSLQISDANRQVSAFTDSDIVAVFREKAKGGPRALHPTDEEWKRLVSQFSQSVPLTFSAMGRNVILSANEMRVCVLLLSGFKIADIAILLDCSPQSVTNMKARANNKLFAESSAATLEKNLMKTVGLPQA